MPQLWIPTVDDFVAAAAEVLDTNEESIRRLPGISLAESALAAPFAAYEEHDAYPELLDKAVVLIQHLARNHPLPDGNKRVALAIAILFLERNGERWREPDHDRDVAMVEQIADGSVGRDEIAGWIAERRV